jgi:mannosylfructose-phosphate synthase
VLALGRIAKNKGYDLLLQAMPPVIERIPEARLVLAVGSTAPSDGEIELAHGLRDLAAELGIADRVVFKDYIQDSELADYYRAADVFALSSRYEPFGMTAIEAMACGTPTVVTTEGGLCEQVAWGIEAVYANPFDPHAYGHAIAAVLQHPRIAAQLSKFGPRKARSRFTWTGIAQQLLMSLESRRGDLLANVDGQLTKLDEYVAEEAMWGA